MEPQLGLYVRLGEILGLRFPTIGIRARLGPVVVWMVFPRLDPGSTVLVDPGKTLYRKEAGKKAGCSDGKGRRYEKGGIVAIVEGEAHGGLGLRGGLLGVQTQSHIGRIIISKLHISIEWATHSISKLVLEWNLSWAYMLDLVNPSFSADIVVDVSAYDSLLLDSGVFLRLDVTPLRMEEFTSRAALDGIQGSLSPRPGCATPSQSRFNDSSGGADQTFRRVVYAHIFWNEFGLVITHTSLSVLFPGIYALEIIKDCTVADKLQFSLPLLFRRYSSEEGVESSQLALLQTYIEGTLLSNMEDRWVWDLNGEGRFLALVLQLQIGYGYRQARMPLVESIMDAPWFIC
ncbi:hypothetical protein Tco_0709209 [Tanacetum coccineum]